MRMHAVGAPVYLRLITVYTISAAHRGRRGRASHPDQPVRRPQRARLRALRRAPRHADPRRRRPHLRRLRRPGRSTWSRRTTSPSSSPSTGTSASALCSSGRALRPRRILGISTSAPTNGGVNALETRTLCKSFGALTVAQRHRLPARAGRPPCADRPERRRQDHLRQHADRRARAELGPHPARRRGRHAHAQAQRVKRGLGRTFQINALFSTCRCSITWPSAIAEREAWPAPCGARPPPTARDRGSA